MLSRRLIPAHAGKTGESGRVRGRLGAHPRSRGENTAALIAYLKRKGSSPLTRGKHVAPPVGFRREGLIPAHAGKTRNSTKHSWTSEAHPRSRGENSAPMMPAISGWGSSPLTRGKPCMARHMMCGRGLIPAHAGKTGRRQKHTGHRRAHPRSRGENLEDNWKVLEADGSSPLTRGKREGAPGERRGPWLIPAHAGKTLVFLGGGWPPRAHPRSRGENLRLEIVYGWYAGSSPLTRGKPDNRTGVREGPVAHPRSRGENGHEGVNALTDQGSSPLTRGKLGLTGASPPRRGLIPAHAGKTVSATLPVGSPAAHPRSRGENADNISPALLAEGSSPLTRGKPVELQTGAGLGGLIPAHAGKTPTGHPAASRHPAHPRSRGENRTAAAAHPISAGSSPLTRGKHTSRVPGVTPAGLIPAHAGKTL